VMCCAPCMMCDVCACACTAGTKTANESNVHFGTMAFVALSFVSPHHTYRRLRLFPPTGCLSDRLSSDRRTRLRGIALPVSPMHTNTTTSRCSSSLDATLRLQTRARFGPSFVATSYVTSSHAATLCYGRVVTIYCPLHWEGATVPVGSAAAASPASTNGQSHQEGDLRFTIAAQPLGAGISQITSLGSFMRATFTISFTALVTCIIAILALSALQPASNRRSPDPSVVRQSMSFLIFAMIGYVSAGTSSEATYTLDGDHWAMLDTLLGILLNGHGIYRARRSALLQPP